jgi:SAM-dependent methyltransferase
VDIKEAELLGGDIAGHWYYRAKLAAVRSLLAGVAFREILDVGAGMGFFSRELLRGEGVESAICVDPGYERDSEESVDGKPLLFRRRIERSAADLVLMMDVLEHVPDDVALAGEYAEMARPGTHFIVTVPAFAFLWSGHDVFLEHYRRYTLAGIERVLRAAGLRIERGCYFYGALFPLVAAARLAGRLRSSGPATARSDMREFSPPVNTAFWAVCRAELAVFRANRLGGLTAFVHATRP